MREILFRAQSKYGEWYYGGIVHQTDYYGNKVDVWFIIDGTETMDYAVGPAMKVVPETVCQYTGLTDRNGVKIFEWDIVRHYSGGKIEDDVGKIFYDTKNCKFLRTSKTNPKIHYELHADLVYEVIGNIYDNPELTEGLL